MLPLAGITDYQLITNYLPFSISNSQSIHIGYAQTFEEAYERMENLYKEEEASAHENPPVEDFFIWRDLRVFDGKIPSALK